MADSIPSTSAIMDVTTRNYDFESFTDFGSNDTNTTDNGTGLYIPNFPKADIGTLISMVFYGIMCVLGLFGNGLVVYVICRFTKMKTVTNLYILNLAIADAMFLIIIPLLITTGILKTWIFGAAMCKLYYILYSINMFTGAFTLTVMSGDRYLAVCFPISSMRFRTPFVAKIACGCTWGASFLVMFPVILYAQTKHHHLRPDYAKCTIEWPDQMNQSQGYICYSLILGFVVPVLLICILYTLLIIRLKSTGPRVKSAEKKRSHRKITKLVTLIIGVYILCWLPYWAFQIYLITMPSEAHVSKASIYLLQSLTFLSYANSMLNPFLYAFTNEAFRDSFIAAFKCLPVVHSKVKRQNSDVETTAVANNNSGSKKAKLPRQLMSKKRIKTLKPEHDVTEFTALNPTSSTEGSSSRLNGVGKPEKSEEANLDTETADPLVISSA